MNKCIVCENTNADYLYKDILKCRVCGHVFFDFNQSQESLFQLYNENYFSGNEYSDYLADRGVAQKNFDLRLKVLQTFLDPVRHRHLLEIGCAYGFFLHMVKDRFETVKGIDIAKKAVLYAKEQLKLDVINADFLKYDFDNQRFNVVCMWDTIEHLQNPHAYLEKVRNLMEKGSLIAITTGDIESLNARIRKEKWRLIHPPTHIHYFSKNTLTRLLDNYGFDIVYRRYCGFYRSIDVVAYRTLVLKKGWSNLYDFLRKRGLGRFNFYLNLYDIMYVIGRRR